MKIKIYFLNERDKKLENIVQTYKMSVSTVRIFIKDKE